MIASLSLSLNNLLTHWERSKQLPTLIISSMFLQVSYLNPNLNPIQGPCHSGCNGVRTPKICGHPFSVNIFSHNENPFMRVSFNKPCQHGFSCNTFLESTFPYAHVTPGRICVLSKDFIAYAS